MIRLVLTLTCAGLLASATTAWATPIPVTNSDFTSEDFSGWTTVGSPHSIQFNAGDPFGWMRYTGTYIEQNLGVAVDESSIYTFNASQFTAAGGWGPSHYLQLIARDGGGDQVLGRVEGWNPDSMTPHVPQLQVSGSELAGAAGKDLVIRLGVGTQGGSNAIAGFDDISVTTTPGVGMLGAPTSLTILNHSFEDGPDNNTATHWPGSGWRAGSPGGYGGYLPGFGAQDGNIAMAANNYQVLTDTFIEGAVYTLSGHFWNGGNGAHGMLYLAHDGQNYFGNNTMTDYLDGVTAVADNSQWLQSSFEYVATAADDGNQIVVMARGGFWDNIELSYQLAEVSAVPEPGTYALGLFALAAVGLLAWRRRR